MFIRTLRRFFWILCLGVVLPLQAQATGAKDVPNAPPAPAVQNDQSPLGSLLAQAKTFIGRPYRWGGSSPKGFDCSGFVRYVFNSIGVDLNRSSRDQSKDGSPVALDHILPGDLLFFSTRGMRRGISHVGIYLGEGQFIHASNWGGPGKRCVRLGELASSYFADRLVAARRVVLPMAEDSKVPLVEDSKNP